ncbi:hypothetical protein [Streptomyces chiangmaiensis]|uniref:Uncharacterized protein n=1 Tax=Streptomyces chiangmaiensis TaxID=766497 RepID=A0ABU7FSH8_9ACTN|nr:hypothetical protein [Streptomyces chiangmaiensis]MED7826074.1 hypothetical protein [Streptomyces chiangmaiensis]
MDASEEAARGLSEIEDFLYREAHLQAAQRRVADFIARMPELTQEQTSDIEHWYVEEQTHVAQIVTQHIEDSISVAEAQFRTRMTQWRRGALAAVALLAVTMMGLCSAVILGRSI